MTFVKTSYCEFGSWKDVYIFMQHKNLNEIYVEEVGYFSGTLKIKSGFTYSLSEVKDLITA